MLTFGEPYEASNGTVIVTVTRRGRAAGVFTVTERGATWTPVVDTGRIRLVGVCTGLVAATLATLAMVRRPPWPELTERVMLAFAGQPIRRDRHERASARRIRRVDP